MHRHYYNYTLCVALLLTNLALKAINPTRYIFGNTTIELVAGDVTNQTDVDAIVNAANESLIGSAGIAAIIQKKAGAQLIDYIHNDIPLNKDGVRCPTGQIKVSPGFDLPNSHIIHAVGPRGSDAHRASLLRSTYSNIMSAINPDTGKPFVSLAIPTISIGIFGYPYEEAADIVVDTITSHAKNNRHESRLIRLVFFNDHAGIQSIQIYKEKLAQHN